MFVLKTLKKIENMNFSKYKEWIIPALLVLGSILTTWIVILLLKYFLAEIVVVEYWPATLVLNLLGYGYIFLPGYAVFEYLKKNNYHSREYISTHFTALLSCACSLPSLSSSGRPIFKAIFRPKKRP